MKKKKTSTDYLLIVSGAVLGIILVLLIFKPFGGSSRPLTLNEMHDRTINGYESEFNYLYNGFSFVFVDGLWYTRIKADNRIFNIPLHHGPKQVEDVPIIGNIMDFILYSVNNFDREGYITFNPEDENLGHVALAKGELIENLFKTIGMTFLPACAENITEACGNVDIITCDNTNMPVIHLREHNDTAVIYNNNNCVYIQGNEMELVRAVDRALLRWYGVME